MYKKENVGTTVDPKEITHYYVDGGVNNNVGVAAFVRKKFRSKDVESTRKYHKTMRSTDAEIRAIKIAMYDAIKNEIDPSTVVIHTDQKQIVTRSFKNSKEYAELTSEIDSLGFILAYSPSVHNVSNADLDKAPKKVLNALRVHDLVSKEFAKPHNRYRHHLNKKRYSKK